MIPLDTSRLDIPSQGPGKTAPAPHQPGRPRARVWLWLVLAFLILGAGLRLRDYLLRPSYWNDEAFVVLNAMDHPAKRLLGPLDYKQAAPPVFLWIERAEGLTLGWGELSLRLFPLLAGLVSMGLFALLAPRVLPLPAAAFAVGLYALNDKLIDYCAQVKQYSSDGLLACALLLIAVGMRHRWSAVKRLTVLSLVTAAGVWLSHTSVIVFGALSLGLLAECWAGGWRGRLAWVLGNGLVLVSLAALYLLSIRLEHDRFLYEFWAQGFPPLHHPGRIPLWLGEQLRELTQQPFPSIWVVVATLELLGAIWLVRRDRTLLWACVGPVALTVAAAFLHQYPFSPSRLTLFMMPGMLLVCAAAVELLRTGLPRPWRGASLALPAVVLGYGVAAALVRAIHPLFHSHIRPAVAYVRAHRLPGDALIITGQRLPEAPEDEPTRHLEFFCYWRHPDPPVYTVWPPPGGIPSGRFWIVYPYSPRHGSQFIAPLLEQARSAAQEQGKPFVVKQGAAAHLFVGR